MKLFNSKLVSRPLIFLGAFLVLAAIVGTLTALRVVTIAGTALQSGVVGNAAPSVDAVVPSDASGSGSVALPAAGLTLNEGTPRNLYVRGTVSDPNGCEDIAGVTVTAFRSGATGGSSCTLDANDCYLATVAKAALTGCTGAGDTDATFEVAIPVANFADPTDAGSPYASENWRALVAVTDVAAQSGSLAADFEVQSLAAFAVAPALMDYGTIALGATSAQQSLVFTNVGNRAVGSFVRADGAMHSSLAGFADVPSTQTHYDMSQAVTWASGTPIGLSDSDLPLGLVQQTADAGPVPTARAYFYLKLPATGIRGTYTNTLYFTAYANGGTVAQGISNGMAADFALGQRDANVTATYQPNYSKINSNDAPNRVGLSSPAGLAVDTVHHRLFVADSGKARVLVYNLTAANALEDIVPDYVLGQVDFNTVDTGQAAAATSFLGVHSLAYDSAGNRLFVGDDYRILVFDVTTITNGEAAVNVLGQASFEAGESFLDASTTANVADLDYDAVGHRLFAVDAGHYRVLVFDVASITNGEAAAHVLGQPDFLTALPYSISQNQLAAPLGSAYDAVHQRLFVADGGGIRVMVFDVAAITDGENAVNVLGQTGFDAAQNGNGASSFTSVADVAYDGDNNTLFVADDYLSRVTVFDAAAITDGEAAVRVLGQPDFATHSHNATQDGLYGPTRVVYDSLARRLIVSDTGNRRIMAFDVAAVTNGENAVAVLGQAAIPSVNSYAAAYDKSQGDNAPNRVGFAVMRDVVIDQAGHRLFALDSDNNRVLEYDLDSGNLPLDGLPDHVLGQPNFDTNAQRSTSSSSLSSPSGLAYDEARDYLFVADTNNNRVTVFDVASITDGEAAIRVLGKPDFETNMGYEVFDAFLNQPIKVAYDNTTKLLYVADSGDRRVMVFDATTITNGESAVHVLGQPDFETFSVSLSASSTTSPGGLAVDEAGERLFVADINNRVMVFDIAAITNGEAAANVLGQSDFTTSGSDLTATSLSGPMGLAYDVVNRRLFVGDGGNARVLVYDAATITNGEAAVNVLGQPDFVTNNYVLSQSSLGNVWGLSYSQTGNHLYVADSDRNRILIFEGVN